MGIVLCGMTMSLDGFVEDANGGVSRLYPDLAELGKTDMLQESIATTGAVVMGRRAFAMGDPDSYVDHYEYQVPIFVLTRRAPDKLPKQNESLTFTFVSEGVESAIRQARAAAGDKDVSIIGGASTAQQCLRAGLVDEIQIGVVPVLLGGGLRFFEGIPTEKIQLEKIRLIDSPARTDIWYRVNYA